MSEYHAHNYLVSGFNIASNFQYLVAINGCALMMIALFIS